MTSVQGLNDRTRVIRITVFVRWVWSSKAWIPRPPGERSHLMDARVIGERSGAVLRTAMPAQEAVYVATVRAQSNRIRQHSTHHPPAFLATAVETALHPS